MFWELFILSLAILLYVYAFRGILNQASMTIMNINRTIRKIMLCIIIIIHGLFTYFAFYHYGKTETYAEKISEPSLYYEKCGKVFKKIEGYNKDEYSDDEKFVVHYNNGDVEKIHVSRKTFDKYKVGEGICFAEETDWYNTYKLLIGLGGLLSIIGGFICVLYACETEFN